MSEDNIENLPSIEDYKDKSEELPSVDEFISEEKELPSVEDFIQEEKEDIEEEHLKNRELCKSAERIPQETPIKTDWG